MALLTPRHVIHDYNELLAVDERTTQFLNSALLHLKEEIDNHRRTRRRLAERNDQIGTLEGTLGAKEKQISALQVLVERLTSENMRMQREISILRSQS